MPVAKFCLNQAIPLQDLTECCKQAMIEIAEEKISRDGDKVTISRLSVMTGLHRRDVMRIYRQEKPKEQPLSLAARVIGQWTEDKRFTTSKNKARILRDGEFSQLVSSVSKDLNPATILYELERIGAIEKSKRGLKLVNTAHKSDHYESLRIASKDAKDLIELVEENINSDSEDLNLHIRTEYDNILQDAIPKLRKWLLIEGSKFHAKARKQIAKYDIDINPELKGPSGSKIILGSFSRTKK